MLGPSVVAVKSSSGLLRDPQEKRYDFTSFGRSGVPRISRRAPGIQRHARRQL